LIHLRRLLERMKGGVQLVLDVCGVKREVSTSEGEIRVDSDREGVTRGRRKWVRRSIGE
jgi:hypothetical protein